MSTAKPQLLIKIAGPLGAFEKLLEGDVIWLGRATDCELPLEHPNVSRRHLKIFRRDGKIWLVDPGSANGTLFNGVAVTPKAERTLAADDVLTLGTSGITVRASDPTELPDETILYPSRESRPEIPLAPPALPSFRPEPESSQAPAAGISLAPPRASSSHAVPVTPVGPAVAASSTPVREPTPAPAPVINTAAIAAAEREAEERLRAARQEAARLTQAAIGEAELRVQEIYENARASQVRAEEIYKQRQQQAYRDAEVIHEQHRAGAQELLQDARKQAQEIRDQAQRFAGETRSRTEQQCEELLREAEEQGRRTQAQRLAEADDILREREARLMQSLRDEQTKLDELNTKLVSVQKEIESANETLRDLHEKARATREGLEQQTQKLADAGAEQQKAVVELARVTEEKQLAAAGRDQLREEAARLSLETSSLANRRQQVEEEHERQVSRLKIGFEDERARLGKQEEETLNQMRLESTRKVQAYEKELLAQLQGKLDLVGREIVLAVESAWKARGEANASTNSDDLHQVVVEILRGRSGHLSDSNVQAERRKLLRARRRERWTQAALGAVAGIVLLQMFSLMRDRFQKDPLRHEIAGEVQAERKALADRQFRPPQTPELKPNYTDAVLYTQSFTATYTSDAFQRDWVKFATGSLYKTWRMDEDRSLRTVSTAVALVSALQERRDKIHPDYVNDGIKKMREIETEGTAKMKELLGSEVRFEAFKKMEKEYYERFGQAPKSAAN